MADSAFQADSQNSSPHEARPPALLSYPAGSQPDTLGASLFRRHRLAFLAVASVVSFGGAVAAFAVADDVPLPSSRRVVEDLAAPDTHVQREALADRNDVFVSEERIRRGDTLGALMTRLGISDADAERFLRTAPATRSLQQLKPGRLIQAHTDGEGELQWLRYAYSTTEGRDVSAAQSGHSLVVERQGETLVAHDVGLVNERHVELRSGEIRSSLFAATDDAGLPDGIATQIAEIFSGDIDFYRDLRRGDRFRVVYESYYQGGEFVRAGRILAVEFVNGGKPHSAMWYGGPATTDAAIAGHYYGFDGRSLHRAFLRTPLEFTRISSGFGGRLHPIANVWRQHTGVDYAAPIGTPVRTTADGTVDFSGVQNGYGNVVIIKHQGVYSTLYGHLSRFAAGLKRGQHIEQGTLIGYVGMTGWATGPHLHYEFRIADRATDPLTAVLPEAPPISRTEQAAFKTVATSFDRQIALLRASEGAIEVATASPRGARAVDAGS
ncbi:MAG: peptidoglycan DD-metalloendopeptidase family protein [Burkholderiaceae bacterium]